MRDESSFASKGITHHASRLTPHALACSLLNPCSSSVDPLIAAAYNDGARIGKSPREEDAMTRSLFLAPVEPHAGTSLLSLGILDYVLRKTRRVGIFRPVIHDQSVSEPDKTIELLLKHFRLDQTYDQTYALTTSEADELLARNQYDQLLNRIIGAYQLLEQRYDFILCLGSDSSHEVSA
jgi:hypothetical protein